MCIRCTTWREFAGTEFRLAVDFLLYSMLYDKSTTNRSGGLSTLRCDVSDKSDDWRGDARISAAAAAAAAAETPGAVDQRTSSTSELSDAFTADDLLAAVDGRRLPLSLAVREAQAAVALRRAGRAVPAVNADARRPITHVVA